MTLLLLEEDIKKVLTFKDTIEAVESAYNQYGKGLAGLNSLKSGYFPPPRTEIRVEGKEIPHGSPKIKGIQQSMYGLNVSCVGPRLRRITCRST